MNHRALHRVYFRMFMDESFRAAVLAGATELDLGLSPDELSLLTSLSAAAIAADRDDSRRQQALGNLLSELQLTAARAPASWFERGFPDRFLKSSAFHQAIDLDQSLPLAFAAWLLAGFQDGGDELQQILALEAALIRCRRLAETGTVAGAENLRLSVNCLLHQAVGGLADFFANAAVPPELAFDKPVMLLLRRRVHANRFALAEVDIEELNPAIAGLLELASEPVGPQARAQYAASLGVSPADLEAFAEELVADGVLVRGR